MTRRARAALAVCLLLAVVSSGSARARADDKQGKALVFRWEKVAGAAEYVIEIAEQSDFATVVVRERVSTNYYRWQSLARRSYYWRVKAIEANGREGKFSEVRVIGAVITAPKLLEPASGARVSWGEQAPGVTLRWEASDLVARYLIEIVPPSGKDPITRDATGGEVVFEPSEVGRWTWRVSGTDRNGDPVPASADRSFVVEVSAPQTSVPAGGAVIPWSEDPLEIRLAWKQRPVKEYTVEVARDRGFKRGVWRSRLSAAAVAYRPIEPGEHVWRVRGAGPDTEWSREASFTVVLAVPAPVAPAEGEVVTIHGDAGAVELRWDAVPLAAGYDVEVTPREGTAGARVSTSVAAPPASLALLPGRYTWTVRARSAAGAQSTPSAPRSFVLEAAQVDPPPPHVVVPDPPVVVVPPVVVRRKSERSAMLFGPGVGVFVRPGAVLAPTVGVEVGLRLPGAARRVRILAGARWYTSSTSVTEAGTALTAHGRFHAVPIAVTGVYELGGFYLGAGATLSVIHASVSVDTQPDLAERSFVWGGVALGGYERRLGAGHVFAEADYTLSQGTGGIARVDPTGLTAVLGYRFWIR